jgi:sortase A
VNWFSRRSSKMAWVAIVLLAISAMAFLYFRPETAIYQPPVSTPPPQTIETLTPKPAVIGLPVRLVIPSLNLDASIEPVGLAADGAMGVPIRLADVAWYQPGPRPGELGNAVIAGHRSSRLSLPAVFDNLDKLMPGDMVNIIDDRGTIIVFRVRERRIYDANADPSEIFAKSDKVHLNLISCAGNYNPLTRSFPQRLVVFTDAI